MLPDKTLAGAKHSRGIARSHKVRSAVATLVRIFGCACAVILICAAAGSELDAQVSAPASPNADTAAETTDPCLGAHLKPTLDCSKRTDSPDNNEDGTKAALACEWVSAKKDAVKSAFFAFRLLTCSTQDTDVRKSDTCRALNRTSDQDRKVALYVRDALVDGATNPNNDPYLYQWALGDPDNDGKLKGTPMATFSDALAKANTLTAGSKKRSKDEEDLFEGELFECTKSLIKGIYQDDHIRGPIILARINDTFVKNKLNLALIQLLDAEILFFQDHDIGQAVGFQDFEKLRAAFEVDSKRLAKQVADKINSSQP